MARDGAMKSIWEDQTAAFEPSQKNIDLQTLYDVIIVGAGITGLTTALLLQEAGKKCILVEAFNIGFGTTGGTTAHLNTVLDTPYYEIENKFSKDDARLVALASQESIQLIDELCRKYNIECDLEYKTGYLFAQTDDEIKELEKIQQSAADAGIKIYATKEVPTPIHYTFAYAFEGQAQFNIGKYITGLAKAFQESGGILLEYCSVYNMTSEEHCLADTTAGYIKASYGVYATHIPPGINILHFRNAAYRSYAMAVTLSDQNYPNDLVYDMKDPYHYFRTQAADGRQYLIAGGYDHKTGHNDNTEQSFRELEAYVRTHYNVDTISYKWSSQYYIPADGLPYIGKLPGYDKIFTGTGYNGNGMIWGTFTGKLITNIITGIESPYERLFAPNRIKLIAGFADFMKENADVVSQFISKRFSYEHIEGLVDLANGDAMLAELDGNKVALYKDDNGKVIALDPVCPHAKCIVAWNNAEKTWDCPCHGGRYACDGTLLTGPAMKGLTPIALEEL